MICNDEKYLKTNYYRFSKYFVDNKYNLKDVMMQILTLNDDTEQKIKQEFYMLLSLFVLTYEYRETMIRKIIYQNKGNFIELIKQF